MKRLIVALIVIMCFALSVEASKRDRFFFASEGGNGGAGLANMTDWTLATGLADSDSNTITMSGLINSDTFDNSSLASFWNSSTANSGTVTETTELVLSAPASADAAIVCYTHKLNPRASQNYRIRMTGTTAAVGDQKIYYGFLEMEPFVPIVNSLASNFANMPFISWQDASQYRVLSYTAGGALRYFDVGVPGLWVAVSAIAHTDINVGEQWIVEIENDGTNIVNRTINPSDNQTYVYAYKAWSTIIAEADDTYFCIGAPFIGTHSGEIAITSFEHFGDFLTTSPTASMGVITVGAAITRLGLFEDCEAGASISWDYDVGAGWVTGKTLAQLETALVGLEPATLNLRAGFASNGTANCSIYSDGASITN